MQLDSQFNVQFADYTNTSPKSQPFTSSRTLHRQYLQLYEQQQIHSSQFSYEPHSSTYNLPQQSQQQIHSNKEHDVWLENKVLRKELEQAYAIIRELREQCGIWRSAVSELRKRSVQSEYKLNNRHGFILQELQAVLQNKTLLDQQVEVLKSELKHNYNHLQLKTDHTLKPTSQNYLKPIRNSLDSRKPTKESNNLSHSQKLFVRSIQNMYQKVVGKSQNNLVVIWRWLKQLAFTYSSNPQKNKIYDAALTEYRRIGRIGIEAIY